MLLPLVSIPTPLTLQHTAIPTRLYAHTYQRQPMHCCLLTDNLTKWVGTVLIWNDFESNGSFFFHQINLLGGNATKSWSGNERRLPHSLSLSLPFPPETISTRLAWLRRTVLAEMSPSARLVRLLTKKEYLLWAENIKSQMPHCVTVSQVYTHSLSWLPYSISFFSSGWLFQLDRYALTCLPYSPVVFTRPTHHLGDSSGWLTKLIFSREDKYTLIHLVYTLTRLTVLRQDRHCHCQITSLPVSLSSMTFPQSVVQGFENQWGSYLCLNLLIRSYLFPSI